MPKLWSGTLETHRREVREAVLSTAAALAAERGLASVTMSEIAERAGIGRATLYKYFPDVEAILTAWHEHVVGEHLRELAAVRARPGTAWERLASVLEAYAFIHHERHGPEVVATLHGTAHRHQGDPSAKLKALLHRGEHVQHAQEELDAMIRDLIKAGVKEGRVRRDVMADELATYCLHALMAAGSLPSTGAVQRLVQVVLSGLKPAR